jgi:HEAT repeat protein
MRGNLQSIASRALGVFVGGIIVWASSPPMHAQVGNKIDNKNEPETRRSNEVFAGKRLYDWMNDLKAKDISVRVRAIAAIKFYGKEARDAAPELIRALEAKDISLRANAAISIGMIGLDAKDMSNGVNALIRCLRDSQWIVRFQAAKALGSLGPDGYPAVTALLSVLHDKNSFEVQMAAAQALGRVSFHPQKGTDRQVFIALQDAAFDTCMEVRLEALYSLIRLGRPAQVADLKKEEQDLKQLTGPRQPKKVAIWAHVAMMRIDKISDEHVKAIAADLLNDKETDVRIHAARALATVGPEARSVIPKLIDALNDKDPEVVIYTCAALGSMDEKVEIIKNALQPVSANHPEEIVKKAAAQALETVGQVKPREEKMAEKRKK